MDSQMIKGILELCILQEVSTEPRYGYLLLKSLTKVFPTVSESGIYTVLRRMHKEDYLTITYGSVSDGPQRKYYSISPYGIEYLAQGKKNLQQLIDSVTAVGLL